MKIFFKKWRTQLAIGTFSVAILLFAILTNVYAVHTQVSTTVVAKGIPNTVAKVQPSPTPTVTYSHLTGLSVPIGQENLHPLAVMIENHIQARPQAGLGQADLVYEALAEGGITRFMAVYGMPETPIKVGPVRSARPYYVDFATELGAMYAHAGGSQDALNQISSTGVQDLNGLSLGEPLFKRDFSRNVDLEHTLYSSTNSLWKYGVTTNGWNTAGNYSSWLFQDDATAANRPTTQTISVSVSDPTYAVKWTYDSATNSYLRFMAGIPHLDANTDKQISVKNVILETVQRADYVETYGTIQKTVGKVTLTGTGPATVFQNGLAIKGTWQKNGTNRTRYYDFTGKEISLVRGKTWIHLIHPDSTVNY